MRNDTKKGLDAAGIEVNSKLMSLRLLLPMHGAWLGAAVGDVVEEGVHARVLGTLLCRAEVVVHHFVYDAVRNAATTVRDPDQANQMSQHASQHQTTSVKSSILFVRN